MLKGQPTLNIFFGLVASSHAGLMIALTPCSSSTGHQANLSTTLPGAWTFLNVNDHSCHSENPKVEKSSWPHSDKHWSWILSPWGWQPTQTMLPGFGPLVLPFFQPGEHSCEWVALPAAPARHCTERAHEQ